VFRKKLWLFFFPGVIFLAEGPPMNSTETIGKRMRFLASEIRRHQDLYYREAKSEISDREYDALFDELIALERKHPDLAFVDSPTRRIGSDLDNQFPEAEHPFPMLSLDKVYNESELREWIDKTEKDSESSLSFVVEEKIDGSTIVLHYEEGVLARAVTRGNGYVGNDITENVRTISDVPLRLAMTVTAVFRGEIYINISDFDALNKGMENIYANPRNFAAGSLRRKKSSEVAKVPLRSFVYEGFFKNEPIGSHIETLHFLSELGFRVGKDVGFFSASKDFPQYSHIFDAHETWVKNDFEGLSRYVQYKFEGREDLGYEIDGLVVKVNENRVRDSLGHTSHHPRWAIAYKFESPQSVSEILTIEPQVGRTGRITPVARIKPVKITGSTVSNVTLHNQDFVFSLDIAVGDRVAVSRRGDVIPAVEEVVEKNVYGNRSYSLPEKCPVCTTPLVQDGAHHFCPNIQCPARVFGRIVFFVSRGQMDIENLGAETIRRLIEFGLISDIPDIYTFNVDDLIGREGFGEKKVTLIKKGIEESKKKPFPVVLASLGLDEIGPKVVELLVDAGYNSIDTLLDTAKKGDPGVFEEIQGIGPKTAEKIVSQLSGSGIVHMIDRLRRAGLRFSVDDGALSEELEKIFEGETWCVTGSFEHFTPREKAMEVVKKHGGKVVSSISSKTTHLLAGANPGSKLTKARNQGTTIVSEEEFFKRLGKAPLQ
jgi:DNA ligase (NAD+)